VTVLWNRGTGPLICDQSWQQTLVQFMPAVSNESREARHDVLRDLAASAVGLDRYLKACVPAGVGFHHAGIKSVLLLLETHTKSRGAGLTTEEREIVAEAYDKGILKVLCCTPTMAAGVNLPGMYTLSGVMVNSSLT
jgi:superfamily II RNA helicase